MISFCNRDETTEAPSHKEGERKDNANDESEEDRDTGRELSCRGIAMPFETALGDEYFEPLLCSLGTSWSEERVLKLTGAGDFSSSLAVRFA